MKINDVILQAAAKLVVFIILTFAVYLFVSGHDGPGGGFVGGLTIASAFVLLLLAFDIETIEKGLPFDFKLVAALGAGIVIVSGVLAVVNDGPFLSMEPLQLAVLGREWIISPIAVFEAGVAIAVVGVVLTIISSISKDV